MLDDNPKPDDREFALDLIRKSAKTASARLQFCRLAFGAAELGIEQGELLGALLHPALERFIRALELLGGLHARGDIGTA